MAFEKTNWEDTIRDENGNIVQKGTAVSAQNLNKIEDGIVEVERTLAETSNDRKDKDEVLTSYKFSAENYTYDIPAGAVAITFDDGYENNLSVAHPLLKERGLPATLFQVSDWMDEVVGGYLSSTQLLQMQNEGWEIGTHTKTHRDLSTLTDDEVRYEISQSKKDLQSIGLNISTLGLPYGSIPKNPTILFDYCESVGQSSSAINLFPKNRLMYRLFPNNEAATTVQQVVDFIQDAKKRGGLAVLGFHRIADDISANAWTVAKFTELLDRLNAGEVFTFREIGRAKNPLKNRKLNKAHYRWMGSEALANPLVYTVPEGYGWDYNTRSIGIDLKGLKKLHSIRVKDMYGSSIPRLNETNIAVYWSDDNVTFTQHTGGINFHHYLDNKLEDNKRSILITLKEHSAHRYWRFHQTINDASFKTRVEFSNIFMDAWVTT